MRRNADYPPPYKRNIARYSNDSPKRSRNRCMCCCCSCCIFLAILITLLTGALLYLYLYFEPQLPSYEVQNLIIKAFTIQSDYNLYSEFLVIVKAENPNKKIGIVYGEDSNVSVSYKGSTLSSGKLPEFYQGHSNTTTIKVVMIGKSAFGAGLQSALIENRQTRRIPLGIHVRVPVQILLTTLKLQQFIVFVDCDLMVDSLSPNQKVRILSENCRIYVKF